MRGFWGGVFGSNEESMAVELGGRVGARGRWVGRKGE